VSGLLNVEYIARAPSFEYAPVAVSSDGRTIAFTRGAERENTTIEIRDLRTGQMIHTLSAGISRFNDLTITFSPDGQTLLSIQDSYNPMYGDVGGEFKFWDIKTGQLMYAINAHCCNATFSPDSSIFVSSAPNPGEGMYVWNARTGELIHPLKNSSGRTYEKVIVSPDGQTLAAIGTDGFLGIWNLRTGEQTRVLDGLPSSDSLSAFFGGRYSLIFTSDSETLISGTSDGAIKIWSVQNRIQEGL
jgi:Tol biopolymer transport system component